MHFSHIFMTNIMIWVFITSRIYFSCFFLLHKNMQTCRNVYQVWTWEGTASTIKYMFFSTIKNHPCIPNLLVSGCLFIKNGNDNINLKTKLNSYPNLDYVLFRCLQCTINWTHPRVWNGLVRTRVWWNFDCAWLIICPLSSLVETHKPCLVHRHFLVDPVLPKNKTLYTLN